MKKTNNRYIKNIIFILFIIFLFLFYYNYYFYNIYLNSDSASGFLMAQDILNGNIFLKDWFLSTSNFVIMIINQVICMKIFGFNLFTFKFSPIITYMIFLFFGCKCCTSSTEDDQSKKYRYLFFLLLMVLPGVISNWTSTNFVQSSMHIESYIIYFMTLLIINKMESRRTIPLCFVLATFIFIGIFSDNILVFCLVLPVILACLLQFIITKKYYVLKILVIVLVSFSLAEFTQKIILTFPGLGLDNVTFVEYNNLFSNLFRIIGELMMYYDSYFFGVKIVSFNGVRNIVGILIFISVIIIFMKNLKKIAIMPFIDQILLLSIIIQFSSYAFSSMGNNSANRYLVPVIFSINLIFSRNIVKMSNLSIGGMVIDSKILLKLVFLLLILSNLLKLTDPINMNKAINHREKEIVKCLEDNSLEKGYAGYWNSHIITLLSEGRVSVAPIISDGKFITQFQWISRDKDYLEDRRFVISPKKEDEIGWGGVFYKNIIKIFGLPIKEIEIADVLILVYDKNLSLEVRSRQRKIYNYDELSYSNAKIENNSLAIMKAGVQYGPYIILDKGSYQVKIEGTNLLEAQVSMTIDRGKEYLGTRTIQQKANSLEYVLDIDKTVKDFEIVVRNNSDTIIGVKSIVIDKIQNSEQEKLMNTKEIKDRKILQLSY